MIRTWPDGRVPYVVDADLPDPTSRRLQDAIERWNASGVPVTLEPRTTVSRDWVLFKAGRVSSSPRGRLGGEQVITLSGDARYGVIMHEIGHTVGLPHEHNRPDREEHIEVLWANIHVAVVSQFQRRDDEPVPSRAYDLRSIMHYAQMAYSKNNRPTIRVRGALPSGVLVGQRRGFSDGDIRQLEDLYAQKSSTAR